MKVVMAANVKKREFYIHCIPSASVFVTAYIVLSLLLLTLSCIKDNEYLET